MRKLGAILGTIWLCALASAEEPKGFPGYEALREKVRPWWTGENAAGGSYAVLVPPGSPLRKAAEKLAQARNGEIFAYAPDAPEDCLAALIAKRARYAAIFVEPKDMDVNLLRKFIVLSTLLDADPFCDVAFGFVTASSPKKVDEFVDRILAAEREGLTDYAIQVSASNISQKYEGSSFLTGMKGEAWYIKQGDTDFAREALGRLGEAGFVHLGACSDPEGIWLFDDHRNAEPEKWWPYDPKKVGQDPKGEMPRITADYFRNVKLKNAVVWTHACHLGAVGRVYVEGDIVSTFGTSDKLEVYTIPEGRSMGLAIIDAGVSAYIAPVGANFGAQSSLERDFASETGVPFGDVLRRAYHDVVMDTEGHPEQIGVFIAGKPKHWDPDGFTNNNAPQHRVLYGDPLFAPFEKRKSPETVTVTAEEKEDGVRISFKLNASGYDVGRTWYGNRGREESGRGRFYEAIPVRKDVEQAYIAEIRTSDADGKAFEVSRQALLVEKIDGKTLLHVQIVTADLARLEWSGGGSAEVSVLQKAGATAEVFVKFGPAPAGGVKRGDRPKEPPKPAAGERAWQPGPEQETPELAARLKSLLAQYRKLKSPSEYVERAGVVLDIGRLRTLPALRALLEILAEDKDAYVRMLLV
ncbi:MAG: hypothetical protein HYY18_18885, partial [Planctomycetes bacterium]|nr:hypothetical protein [Planctomycetota bacterium]